MKRIIILLFALMQVFSASAQDIKKIYDENKMVKQVEFYANGELKNTITIENPYHITSYDSIEKGGGSIIYYLNEDQFENLGDIFFQELSVNSKTIEYARISLIIYGMRAFEMKNGYVMEIHSLDAVDQYNESCATTATGKLYDPEGNFMIEIKPSNKGIYGPKLMKNEKYLAFNINYKVLTQESAWWLEYASAFDVYNVETKELVYSHTPKEAYYYNPPMVCHEYFVMRTEIEKDKMEMFVFFPDKMISYTNYYTKKEGYSVSKFDKDGIIFRTEDGSKRKDYFELSFTQNKIKRYEENK